MSERVPDEQPANEREPGDPDPNAVVKCEVCGQEVVARTLTMHVISERHQAAQRRGLTTKPEVIDEDADLFEEKRAAGNTSEVSLNEVRAVKQERGQLQEEEEQLGNGDDGLDEELDQVQDKFGDLGENEGKSGRISNGSVGPSSDSAAEQGQSSAADYW